MVDVVYTGPSGVERHQRGDHTIKVGLRNEFCQSAQDVYDQYKGEATKLSVRFFLAKGVTPEDDNHKNIHVGAQISEALGGEFHVSRDKYDGNVVVLEKKNGARITTEDAADILSTLIADKTLVDDFGFELRGDFYGKCAYAEHPFVERDGEDIVFRDNYLGGWTSFEAEVVAP